MCACSKEKKVGFSFKVHLSMTWDFVPHGFVDQAVDPTNPLLRTCNTRWTLPMEEHLQDKAPNPVFYPFPFEEESDEKANPLSSPWL